MRQDDTARWQAIEALLDAALDQPAAQRVDYVRRHAGDAALAERVLRLLDAEQAAGDFLEALPQAGSAADEPAQAVLEQIGPWKMQELLGRGGMGEVYRAERADGQYRQTVALKLIRSDDPAQASRFESERQILAQLNHPHIARLIDGGLASNGRPWMAIEYVDGRSLGRWLAEDSPGLDERLRLFLRLCDAVSYAHAHLVVHRDIKPDNILIDDHGEPRLLDFGIAKLTGPGQASRDTQALATPNYAAPEQLTGGPVTTATDVYGLGATLYYLLCEQPPLDLEGASLPQLLDRLQHAMPQPPSRLARLQLPADLDAICQRALGKAASERYPSVGALAEDITRFLRSEPVKARAPALGYRLRLYLRRNRLGVAAGVAVSLSVLAGLAVASWQAHVAANERDAARRDASRLTTMQSAMMQLFKSASSESAELSARELFAHSAEQIERDFRDDPATATRLMQMLGELLLATEDFAAAGELLRRAEARYSPDMGEDILASIQIDLAHIAYRDGELEQARQRHDRAAGIWARQPQRYRAERIWAATLTSQLARADGRPEEAVGILERAASEARQHWGEAHADTGIVLINLAVAHYYNNDLGAALVACERAWAVWQAIDRSRSPDALNLLGNWGLFALRHGDPVTGERRLAEALELRTELYGPSAALATLMKNLGTAHRLNGRRNAGMRLLEQGVWMAEKYAGAGSRLHASAVYALAEALIEDGLPDEARALLSDGMAAAEGRQSPWHQLNRSVLASLMQASDEHAAAQSLFDQSLEALRQYGGAALNQYADALAWQARWLTARGEPVAAAGRYQQAIARKISARREGHFEALRMQGELARLLADQGRNEDARPLLQQARDSARKQFGSEHPLSTQLAAITLSGPP